MLSALVASTGSSVLTTIYILIGIVTIGGGGGALGIWRTSRADRARAQEVARLQGVRDEKIDRVIEVVLGDELHNGDGGINRRFDAQAHQLAEIQREARPNGGQSKRLGDVAKRTEETAARTERKVDDLKTALDRHIGQSEEVHAELRRRMAAMEGGHP